MICTHFGALAPDSGLALAAINVQTRWASVLGLMEAVVARVGWSASVPPANRAQPPSHSTSGIGGTIRRLESEANFLVWDVPRIDRIAAASALD